MSRTYSITKLPQDYQEIIDIFPETDVRKSWRLSVLKSINEILDSQSLVRAKTRMVKVAEQSPDRLYHHVPKEFWGCFDGGYPDTTSLEKCQEDLEWSKNVLLESVERHETLMSMLFDAVEKQLNRFKSRFEKERESYFIEPVILYR